MFLVLVEGQELVGIGRDSSESEHQEQARGCKEAFEGLFYRLLGLDQEGNGQRNGICQDNESEVICDLLVVGFYLEAEGEGEQGGSQDGLRQPVLP